MVIEFLLGERAFCAAMCKVSTIPRGQMIWAEVRNAIRTIVIKTISTTASAIIIFVIVQSYLPKLLQPLSTYLSIFFDCIEENLRFAFNYSFPPVYIPVL